MEANFFPGILEPLRGSEKSRFQGILFKIKDRKELWFAGSFEDFCAIFFAFGGQNPGRALNHFAGSKAVSGLCHFFSFR
ncbi:MAG: hypothetical protein D6714_05615 [Bacteroidetes bacterium]|nr:MAG: hypothetical protein D6714_05615 [Bacteroidota bacterium]